LPIITRYLTARGTEEDVRFRPDIYDRDPALIAALDTPFSLHLPELPKATQDRIRATVPSASKALHLEEEPELMGTPSTPVPPREAPPPEEKPRAPSAWKTPSFL